MVHCEICQKDVNDYAFQYGWCLAVNPPTRHRLSWLGMMRSLLRPIAKADQEEAALLDN